MTGPTPLMVTVVASFARQVRTTGAPGLGLVGGFAVNEVMVGFVGGGGGGVVTVIVTLAFAVPNLLVAVKA